MLTQTPKAPTTLRHAFTLADIVFSNARDATALLDRLPATLARIKQAAEAGETLTPAAAWLK